MFKKFTRCMFLACLLLMVATIAKANDSDVVNCGKRFKIVVLGSSTAFGTGATPSDSSWVSKFTFYVQRKNVLTEIYNLGIPGFTTYQALVPTGVVPPANRPAPVDGYNITTAIALQPDAIIINLPSNDAANDYSVKEQQSNYERTMQLANAAHIPVWVTTTQPRNNLSADQMSILTQMRDWTLTRFGAKAIDFWTTVANGNGTIGSAYTYNNDNVHVNNLGHDVFYRRMLAENVLDSLCSRANGGIVARAGNDTSVVLPATAFTLNGSASTSLNTITSYNWTKISGPQSTQITNPLNALTSLTGLLEGRYRFVLTVTDNTNASNTDTINVIVGSRLLIDIGPTATSSPDGTGKYWNTMAIAQPGAQVTNALTTSGATTAISLEVVNRIDGTFNVTGPGTNTGNSNGDVGDYPNSVTTDFAFSEPSTENGNWKFDGLEAGKQYTFKFWGARSAADERIIQIKRSDETAWQEYNGAANSDYSNAAYFTFTGKTTVSFDIKTKDGSPFGYISVVDIFRSIPAVVFNVPPVAIAGNNISVIAPENTASLNGTASYDEDGAILNYQWTKITGPATVTITGANTATAGLSNLAQGIYFFELAVLDNSGAVSKDTTTVTVSTRILFDFGATATPAPDASGKYWNNVATARTGDVFTGNVTTGNAATAIGLQLTNRIDGTFNLEGPATNTGNTIGDVGDYPNSATTDFAFSEPSTTTGSWKLTGLNNQQQYTVKFWGTRSVDDDRIIQIKRNDESIWQEYNSRLNTDYNNAATFTFSGNSEQSFDIKTKDGSAFGYISVVDILVTTPTAAPCVQVTPAVSITANPATPVCAGTAITFTATAVNGGTTPTYQWTKNGVNILNANGNSYTNNSLANDDLIRCILTSNAVCASTTNATSAAITVAIKAATSSTTILAACNTYTWNGVTYSASGTYIKTGLVNNAGCDSTATLVLTIKVSTSSSTTVAACNTYIWNGFTYIASGTYVKTGLVNKAGCDSTATLVLTINKTVATPGIIDGPTNACPYVVSTLNPNGIAATYKINKVAGATSYNWTVPANVTITGRPGGAGTANDTIIIVKYNSAFVSGNITVTAASNCGNSGSRSLTITKSVAATPGTITGPANACPSISTNTTVTYTINKVNGASDYDWTISGTGASITGHPAGEGINDTIITVKYTTLFTQGTLSVRSISNCGTNTAARTLTVIKSAPSQPTITGNMSVCSGGVATYTANTTGATSYVWTVPSGATIIGANNTATITVRYPSFFLLGSVSVRAVSSCGSSSTTLFLVFNCLLSLGNNPVTHRTATVTTTQTAVVSTTDNTAKSAAKVIESNDLKAAINVFPNPSNGNFSVAVKGNTSAKPVTIVVLNNYGQSVYNTTSADPAIRISIANKLANGMYFIRTMVNGQVLTQKLIISK